MSELSVIVPIHNTELYLPRCLDSILSQTYQDFELILVDDGSTDNSPAICDQYTEKDPRIRVIHEPAQGAVTARETGLKVASGFYATFPDSDDWLDPEMFSTLMATLKENQADCVAAGFIQEGETSQPRENAISSGLYDLTNPETPKAQSFLTKALYSGAFYEPGIIPSLWSKILRRDLLDLGTAPDPTLRMGDDAARLYPALAKAKRVLVLNEVKKYHYRFLPASQANAFDPRYFERADKLLRELNQSLASCPAMQAGLPYYALFILELGIDQYLFHCRRDTKTEKEQTLQKAIEIWEAVRPGKTIDWTGFPADKAEKCRLLTEEKTAKLISLYAKTHFSATIKAVLQKGRAK